uniref:Uncharacterized protein n=1 Tax=Neogobius melanostomus TaxID=47308 RepID=A0A8C6WQV2_9GOBI
AQSITRFGSGLSFAASWPCTGLALPSGVFRSPLPLRGKPVPVSGSTGFEAAMPLEACAVRTVFFYCAERSQRSAESWDTLKLTGGQSRRFFY